MVPIDLSLYDKIETRVINRTSAADLATAQTNYLISLSGRNRVVLDISYVLLPGTYGSTHICYTTSGTLRPQPVKQLTNVN